MLDQFISFFSDIGKAPTVGLSYITHTKSVVWRSIFLSVGLILIVNGMTSCGSKSSRPDGILSKDEMAKVMTEFYLKEARINTLGVGQDSAKKLMQYYRLKYADKSGIADSIIEASYQYYMEHPQDLSEIYDRIIDSLALQEQRLPSGPKLLQ